MIHLKLIKIIVKNKALEIERKIKDFKYHIEYFLRNNENDDEEYEEEEEENLKKKKIVLMMKR